MEPKQVSCCYDERLRWKEQRCCCYEHSNKASCETAFRSQVWPLAYYRLKLKRKLMYLVDWIMCRHLEHASCCHQAAFWDECCVSKKINWHANDDLTEWPRFIVMEPMMLALHPVSDLPVCMKDLRRQLPNQPRYVFVAAYMVRASNGSDF